MCFLRGTDWVFIYVLRFLFKSLKWPCKGTILFRIPNTLFNLSSFSSERNGSFVCLEQNGGLIRYLVHRISLFLKFRYILSALSLGSGPDLQSVRGRLLPPSVFHFIKRFDTKTLLQCTKPLVHSSSKLT